MNVTNARPIISAAAVPAVQPGFLRALSPDSLSVAGSNKPAWAECAQPALSRRALP